MVEKMVDNGESFKIKNLFRTFFPTIIDDIEEKILSPLSCIRELESKWILEFDLPLVDKNDISITLDKGNTIFVEAKLREKYIVENLESRREFHYFKKRVTVPEGIDEKKITSSFFNGRLVINIPKIFSGHKIKVE